MCLVSLSTSVCSGVGSRPQHPGWIISLIDRWVPPIPHCDDLAPPKLRPPVACDWPADCVAPPSQLLGYLVADPFLQMKRPLSSFVLILHIDSWCVQSLLRIHPKLQHVQQHLDVSLRLHQRPHHPQCSEESWFWGRGCGVGEECRYYGVKRPLPPSDAVHVAAMQTKAGAAILSMQMRCARWRL